MYLRSAVNVADGLAVGINPGVAVKSEFCFHALAGEYGAVKRQNVENFGNVVRRAQRGTGAVSGFTVAVEKIDVARGDRTRGLFVEKLKFFFILVSVGEANLPVRFSLTSNYSPLDTIY